LFEVEEIGSRDDAPVEVEVSRGDFNMDDICSIVRTVVHSVREGISEIKTKRTVLEFGVEIGAESGHLTAFIVKGSGKASLKITVEW
jgi:hypothetical protein